MVVIDIIGDERLQDLSVSLKPILPALRHVEVIQSATVEVPLLT